MQVSSVVALICALTLSVAGCSNLGQLDLPRDKKNVPSVKTIVQRIKCELAIIADPNYEYHQPITDGDYVVAVELDLEVNDDGSLAPSFTYTNGVFALNAGAKLDVSRDQMFTVQLFFPISDIRDGMKSDREKSLQTGTVINSFACPSPDTNLAGELGIVDSVHMAFFSEGLATNTKLSGVKGAFGGNVNFVVVKNLNAVGPTYTLTHFKGPGSLAGLSETNTDKLTFAFAQRAATGEIAGASPAKKKMASRIADADAKARAMGLLTSIQTSQITSQLVGIRANTK